MALVGCPVWACRVSSLSFLDGPVPAHVSHHVQLLSTSRRGQTPGVGKLLGSQAVRDRVAASRRRPGASEYGDAAGLGWMMDPPHRVPFLQTLLLSVALSGARWKPARRSKR